LRATVGVDLGNSIWSVESVLSWDCPGSVVERDASWKLFFALDERHVLDCAFHDAWVNDLCCADGITDSASWFCKGETLEVLAVELDFAFANIRSLGWVDLVNCWLLVVLESSLENVPVVAIYRNLKTDVSKERRAKSCFGYRANDLIPFLRSGVIRDSV